MQKQPAKKRHKTGHKRLADVVASMAASGLVEDEIALHLGIDKNTLRAKWIADIKRGKQTRAASEAESRGLRREEIFAANAILEIMNSQWCGLIFQGLNGRPAQSAPEAYARWLRDGARWNCSGFTNNFSHAQVAEFVELKREAKKLLQEYNGGQGRARHAD